MLKESNQEQEAALDVEQEARLDDHVSSGPNADIHDALMLGEEVKKGKTKTPSTGKSTYFYYQK